MFCSSLDRIVFAKLLEKLLNTKHMLSMTSL